jgi:hypothetical protein
MKYCKHFSTKIKKEKGSFNRTGINFFCSIFRENLRENKKKTKANQNTRQDFVLCCCFFFELIKP